MPPVIEQSNHAVNDCCVKVLIFSLEDLSDVFDVDLRYSIFGLLVNEVLTILPKIQTYYEAISVTGQQCGSYSEH